MREIQNYRKEENHKSKNEKNYTGAVYRHRTP
jgi:hypothetical protein